MPVYFDHDAINGTVQTYDYDPTSDTHMITTHQDIKPFLDHLEMLRNNPEYTKKGMKEEFWHYASIPALVEMELKKKGLDIYDKNATKAIIKEINQNYPYLLTTNKRHS